MFQRIAVGFCVAALVCRTAPGQELSAKRWFNNPSFRLQDDRAVALFFFSAREAPKDTEIWIKQLNRLARRPDVVVIGLTRDDPGAVEKFIQEKRIRFTVGAGSTVERGFGVTRVPVVFYRAAGGRGAPAQVERDVIDRMVSSNEQGGVQDPAKLTKDWELKSLIESDADSGTRRAAVKKLWAEHGNNDPQDFIEFAESRVSDEIDPWVRAELRHHCRLARGEPTADTQPNPSTVAFLSFKQNPDAPEWAPVKELQHAVSALSPALLLTEFEKRQTGTGGDLVSRRFIIHEVARAKDKPAARQVLMQILLQESDASNRLMAAGSLRSVCEVGDTEAAGLLDRLAEAEPHQLRARPMMEAVAEFIRTGRLASDPDRSAAAPVRPPTEEDWKAAAAADRPAAASTQPAP